MSADAPYEPPVNAEIVLKNHEVGIEVGYTERSWGIGRPLIRSVTASTARTMDRAPQRSAVIFFATSSW